MTAITASPNGTNSAPAASVGTTPSPLALDARKQSNASPSVEEVSTSPLGAKRANKTANGAPSGVPPAMSSFESPWLGEKSLSKELRRGFNHSTAARTSGNRTLPSPSVSRARRTDSPSGPIAVTAQESINHTLGSSSVKCAMSSPARRRTCTVPAMTLNAKSCAMDNPITVTLRPTQRVAQNSAMRRTPSSMFSMEQA